MNSNKSILSKKSWLCLTALVCCLLWGSAAPCIKIGYRLFEISAEDSISQILFAGLRFFLAGVLSILLGSIPGKKILLPKKASGKMIAVLALFQTVIQYVFYYVGVAHTSGFKTSVINGSATFVTIIIAALIFHSEKLTLRKIAGCLMGFAGIVLINLRSGSNLGTFNPMGDGFLLIAVVSYSVSSCFIKRFSSRENPVVLSGYQFLFGGFIMALAAFLLGGRLSSDSAGAWLMLIYLGLLSAVAYTLWSLLLKYNDVSSVSIYIPMNPVFGVLLSAWLLDEGSSIDWIKCIAALALVTAGVLIVNLKKGRLFSA